jgi:hypothetical protein
MMVNGNEKMRIRNSGNVGIGTTSPNANLHIQENSDPASSVSGLKLSANASGTNKYLPAIEWSYGVNGTPSFAKIETIRASSTGGILAFSTATTSSVMTERIRIDSSGNVGIGTASPASKLDIISSSLTSQFKLSNTTADTTTKYGAIVGRHYTNSEEPVTGMLITSNSSVTGGSVSIGGGISAANAVNNIILYTAANNTTLTGTERMRVASNGNVGIGTTIPQQKLDVIGNIAIKNATQLSFNDNDGTLSVGGDAGRLDLLSSSIFIDYSSNSRS